MKFPLILILLFVSTRMHSQEIVWRGEQDKINIVSHLRVLKDEGGMLGIDQVSSGTFDTAFHLSNSSILNFGYTQSVYWLKFSLVEQRPDSLFLEVAHAFIPEAELFYKAGSARWISIKSGFKVSLNDKVIKDHFQIFPLPSGSRDYYLRIVPYSHPIIVRIWKSKAYQINANRQRMFYGLYVGILFFAIAINIFLFFALKKFYYFQYGILVFLYILSSAGVMEGYMVYFFPKADLMYWYKIIPVLDMPALLLYCLSFLEVKKISLRLYRITLLVCVFLALYFIALHFLPLLNVLIINQVFALIVFLLAIFIGITVGRKGNQLGYYFTMAYSIWFILLCIEVIYIHTGRPGHIFELSYVSIAIFIEAFLLAFLLAKRFQWEKKVDEKARFEMQRNIVEIQQRFQNEIVQAQLEMQEQTFQNISQEIHDNIGQTLSLIKLNLTTYDFNDEAGAREKVLQSKNLISQAITDLRNVAKALNTEYIKNIGLSNAIEHQAKLLEKSGIYTVTFSLKGQIQQCDIKTELLIFRIVQELLNNILKHSNASSIVIDVKYESGNIVIGINDNGQGFDMNDLSKMKSKGLGLQNIINRTRLINGNIVINSKPMRGTDIILTVPITL